jgi:hypothetical protein
MKDKYTPIDCTWNIISEYANRSSTSEEPTYIEPNIFRINNVLPGDLIDCDSNRRIYNRCI